MVPTQPGVAVPTQQGGGGKNDHPDEVGLENIVGP